MNIAKLLGIVFHPSNVIVVVLLLLLYFNSSELASASIAAYTVYGLGIVGLPFAFYIMKRKVTRQYRDALIAIIISSSIFYLLSVLFPDIREVNYAFFGILSLQLLGIIIFLIRFRWKISLHVSILTTLLTVLVVINARLIALLFLIPIVAWSRVRLKAHTVMQVIMGFVVGLLISLAVYSIL